MINQFYRVLVLALVFSACAEVQRVPGPITYQSSGVEQVVLSPGPMTLQTAQISLRPTTVGTPGLEARLVEAPLCDQVVYEQLIGTRVTKQELSRNDKIAMYTGYSIAGLTTSFVVIGLIRGREFSRGSLLWGIYGVPFAALGGYESWRSRDLEAPAKPMTVTRAVPRTPCPKGKDSLQVDIYHSQSASIPVTLGPYWRGVTFATASPELKERRAILPVSIYGSRFAAYLPAEDAGIPDAGPLTAITARSAPPLVKSKPLPVSAPTEAPLPVIQEVDPVAECKAAGIKTDNKGWLPRAFFAQKSVDFALKPGQSLAKLAQAKLGGDQNVWQIYEMNRLLARTEDGIYRGKAVKIQLPAKPLTDKAWKEMLPPACR